MCFFICFAMNYIPQPFQIFTRILRSLNLPVGTSQMIVPRYVTNAYDISHVVLWVSSLLVRSKPHSFCIQLNVLSPHCICVIDLYCGNFREDPANRLKHSSVAFSTVSHPSSIHQTMAVGW